MTEMQVGDHSGGRQTYQRIGFVLGPLAGLLVFFLPAPEGITEAGWHVVALAAWMAVWWGTEAIPIPATSLLPLIVFPLLGVTSLADAASPYAQPVIFLLLGGFIIAMAMQRWNLHRRIALMILYRVGTSERRLILGFMIAAALLSMWVSNTATTLMMIPIALSVAEAVAGDLSKRTGFVVALLLGVPYAASIGGMGTLVGTPPNAMMAGFLNQTYGIEVGFVQWMALGVPVVILLVPLAWFVLTRLAFRVSDSGHGRGRAAIREELAALGPISRPERRTLYAFITVALLWVFRPLIDNLPGLGALSDTIIAVGGAVALFLIPAGSRDEPDAFLLDWETAVKLPWGVVLLFGGGLSLAAAVQATGLAVWLGESLVVLTTFHLFILTAALVALIVFLTELTSNTATTAGLLPVLGAIALAGQFDPMLLAAPAALAASCAFMLPVATAPNAIIFAGGHVTIPEMVKAGFRINLIAIAIISTLSYALVPLIFG